MSGSDPRCAAADALRKAAAELISEAERLEALVPEPASDGSEPAAVPLAPLAPPANSDEAGARLVVLDLSSRGVSRAEAEAALAEAFPDVEAGPLLDRFYPA